MLNPVRSNQFKRDYKLAKKRGKDLSKLFKIMDKLMREEVLDPKNRDHKLTGEYVGCRECHIEPDTLLERMSLEGVCRIFDISMPWLLDFIDDLIQELPENLNAEVIHENDEIEVVVLEADELWSYVGSKDNPQWLWLVMHSRTRQVVAMQVGSRSKQTAEKLFYKLPEPLKKALYYTDFFFMYSDVIPYRQHRPVSQDSGKTSYIERLNCTLRQRCPRLVRKTLSFSKKLANHISMIAYFICDYNLRVRTLHV